MDYQIVIYSADAVFARMLELEFRMQGMSVLTVEHPRDGLFSDVALLDLDSSHAPLPESYHRMIGFTRGSAISEDGTRRQCSMILSRPFEMRLLRREIMGEQHVSVRSVADPAPSQMKLMLDSSDTALHLNGQKISLTPKEAIVMKVLLAKRGTPVSREEISGLIGESVANKSDVYICYLRRKLEGISGVKIIHTVRGKGYCIP
jgi:hypothetical protein